MTLVVVKMMIVCSSWHDDYDDDDNDDNNDDDDFDDDNDDDDDVDDENCCCIHLGIHLFRRFTSSAFPTLEFLFIFPPWNFYLFSHPGISIYFPTLEFLLIYLFSPWNLNAYVYAHPKIILNHLLLP